MNFMPEKYARHLADNTAPKESPYPDVLTDSFDGHNGVGPIMIAWDGKMENNVREAVFTDRTCHKKVSHVEFWCRSMKAEKQVVPGESWGRLSEREQSGWLGKRCDTYFCAPNAQEGKGVYSCATPG